MEKQAARIILKAAADAADATAELFKAIDADGQGELSDTDMIAVVLDYCDAKDRFESAVTTRGVIG